MANPLIQIRRLIIALIISGAMNIILLATFFYLHEMERPPTPYYEHKPAGRQEQQTPLAIEHSNSEIIRYFRNMPLEWLIARLNNTQLIENGYSQRDLALATLVAVHHFDLERALAGLPAPTQKRRIVYGKYKDGRPAELIVYPGLSEKQYEVLVAFASTERWPLTSQGLFLTFRKGEHLRQNPSLTDAFFITPEFLAVERLFTRGEVPADKQELLTMLLQNNWEALSSFVEQQKSAQDLSPARRQRFLLDYIEHGSTAAALLLLKCDEACATTKLDDQHVVLILQLLENKSPEAERFAKSLLTSPRSDAVWHMAATRLYEYAGEAVPEKPQHNAALSRFMPQQAVIKVTEQKPPTLIISAAPPIQPPPPRPVIKPVVPPPQQTLANKPLPPKAKAQTPAAKPIASAKPLPFKKDSLYIVQDGDTLWKIAKRFGIDVSIIRSHNRLESDNLRPGQPLRIPTK